MAKIDGIVSEAGALRSKKRLLVTNEESGQVEEHLIPHGKHVLVQPETLCKRDSLSPKEQRIRTKSSRFLALRRQEYLIEEIQKVYRLQGVTINDKHLEVIISACFSRFALRILETLISSGAIRSTGLPSWMPTT